MLRTVARSTDVPRGQIRAFEVGDESAVAQGRSRIPLLGSVGLGRSRGRRIALANVAGEFFAIDDTCTHAQCSLGDGRLLGAIVQCACHRSQFNVKSGAAVDPCRQAPVRRAICQVE